MRASPQKFDVAVLVRSILRPSLLAAVRSIYAQVFAGRVQVLVGVDAVDDRSGLLEQLRAECPAHMRLDVLNLAEPTAVPRGGLYTNGQGGVLPVLMAYSAQARHVIFLDDDNWMAPSHLQSLRDAAEGFHWAYSLRWFVDDISLKPLCVDEWESVGPGKGAFAEQTQGFVDPNCLMFDKLACHLSIPWLAVAMFPDFSGHDRLFFRELCAHHSVGWTGKPTAFYVINRRDTLHRFRRQWFASKGLVVE